MVKPKESIFIKMLVLATYLAMIIVNALANILPINGVKTGQVSNAYPNLFAPAAITFIIWGLIYLLLAGHVLYQLGSFRDIGTPYKHELLSKIGLIFSISSLANVAWIFSWHNFMIPFSMLWMIIILLCLITLMQTINKEQLSRREKLLVKLPFSIYFGWITVATIANATVLLVSLKWSGWGIAEPVWAVIIIIVGVLIGAVTTIKNRDIAYGLVIVWAYAGIYIKHTSAAGYAGQYPAIINTVITCVVLMLAVLTYVFIDRKRSA
jgi:hypothetical protein